MYTIQACACDVHVHKMCAHCAILCTCINNCRVCRGNIHRYIRGTAKAVFKPLITKTINGLWGNGHNKKGEMSVEILRIKAIGNRCNFCNMYKPNTSVTEVYGNNMKVRFCDVCLNTLKNTTKEKK